MLIKVTEEDIKNSKFRTTKWYVSIEGYNNLSWYIHDCPVAIAFKRQTNRYLKICNGEFKVLTRCSGGYYCIPIPDNVKDIYKEYLKSNKIEPFEAEVDVDKYFAQEDARDARKALEAPEYAI